jgi:hypothetical protein
MREQTRAVSYLTVYGEHVKRIVEAEAAFHPLFEMVANGRRKRSNDQ